MTHLNEPFLPLATVEKNYVPSEDIEIAHPIKTRPANPSVVPDEREIIYPTEPDPANPDEVPGSTPLPALSPPPRVLNLAEKRPNTIEGSPGLPATEESQEDSNQPTPNWVPPVDPNHTPMLPTIFAFATPRILNVEHTTGVSVSQCSGNSPECDENTRPMSLSIDRINFAFIQSGLVSFMPLFTLIHMLEFSIFCTQGVYGRSKYGPVTCNNGGRLHTRSGIGRSTPYQGTSSTSPGGFALGFYGSLWSSSTCSSHLEFFRHDGGHGLNNRDGRASSFWRGVLYSGSVHATNNGSDGPTGATSSRIATATAKHGCASTAVLPVWPKYITSIHRDIGCINRSVYPVAVLHRKLDNSKRILQTSSRQAPHHSWRRDRFLLRIKPGTQVTHG